MKTLETGMCSLLQRKTLCTLRIVWKSKLPAWRGCENLKLCLTNLRNIGNICGKDERGKLVLVLN
jgi:hypothetical protein